VDNTADDILFANTLRAIAKAQHQPSTALNLGFVTLPGAMDVQHIINALIDAPTSFKLACDQNMAY